MNRGEEPKKERKDERVLMLLASAPEAETLPRELERVGLTTFICRVPGEVCVRVNEGAGVLLLDEEAVSAPGKEELLRGLTCQPNWSELPIIVLLHQGAEPAMLRDLFFVSADVTALERPVRINDLVAVIRSALGNRRRQYLVRDQLRALEESENRFRTLFESIDEGFCVIEMIYDPQGNPVDYRFIEMNPSFEKQTGLIDARGKGIKELAPGLEEHWFRTYGEVARTGQAVRFENEAAALHRWYDVYAFRVGETDNRQVAVLFKDITERKSAESELRSEKGELELRVQERTAELSAALDKLRVESEERIQAVEELRRKEELLMQQGRMAAMGEMIGFIAHQWRQPLNTLALMIQEIPIRLKSGHLVQGDIDETTTAALRVIRQMSQTINDFRDFFRSDRQKITFDVKDVLLNTLKLTESSFREVLVQIEVEAEEGTTAEGYPNEFSQVFLNILMNARDAFLDRRVGHPRIAVRIFSKEGKAVVTITDNAGGIPEELLEKIFDPYFTTKGPEKGTGIGLYLARTIIEKNMGGRVTAENVAGGALFRIEI